MKRLEWFERRFTFGLPAGMLPFYIERLQGTIARIESKVKGVSEEVLSHQLDDKWSVKQNIGHLAEVDEIANKRIGEMINGISPMSPAVFEPRGDYNQQSIEEVIGYFRKTRYANVKQYGELSMDELERSSLHPRLKIKMTPIDLAWFDAEHDDHHLVRMNEILSVLLKKSNVMYVPKQFRNNDASTINDFIRHHGFGILVSQSDSRMVATHIPLELSEDETKLRGHIAKANPQWKNFQNNSEVMVIFPGPHAYVSSSWYDHENVPTWNYIAVHVYGKIQIIEGDELYSALKQLVDKYEKKSEYPVSIEKMSPEYVRQSIQGLVGFAIEITSIEAAYKLSQNRDRKNYVNVINELEKRGDYDSKSIADEMKKIEK